MEIRSHDKMFPNPSRTKQSFKQECDINYMLNTYQKTGQMPPINPRAAQYGNFTLVTDFHTAINQVKDAEQAFLQYPSELRKRFGNKPEHLITFLEDPENHAEAVELGLMAPDSGPETKDTQPTPSTPIPDVETPQPGSGEDPKNPEPEPAK